VEDVTAQAKRFLEVESQFLPIKHKMGVLSVQKDQGEEKAVFANAIISEDFQEFLSFLGTHYNFSLKVPLCFHFHFHFLFYLVGDSVDLLGFTGYAGGLDILAEGRTGKKSVYVQDEARRGPIMFHVAPLIPEHPSDPTRKRYTAPLSLSSFSLLLSSLFLSSLLLSSQLHLFIIRHIGNDVVVILFNESGAPIDVTMFKSQFNRTSSPTLLLLALPSPPPPLLDVFVVVSKVSDMTTTHYRVEVAVKNGVLAVPPFIPFPPIFEKSFKSQRWFHTKCTFILLSFLLLISSSF